MRRIKFDEVSISATRRWIDERGKSRQETKKFWQTVNPFNRNADGVVKTSEEILDELIAERDIWLKRNN